METSPGRGREEEKEEVVGERRRGGEEEGKEEGGEDEDEGDGNTERNRDMTEKVLIIEGETEVGG
jgi:hypothetical protein